MKLGVAISCYNLVNDVALTVEIIRRLWSSHNDAHIVVACNHPESLALIKKLDVDEAIAGSDLPFDTKPRLRRRQVDCWQRANRAASQHSDYVIHFHADAHALYAEPIVEIIEDLRTQGRWVAGRGKGMEFRRSGKTTYGDVDDHFFVSDSVEARRSDLWHVDPGKMLETINSESFLSYSIQTRLGRDRFYHYSDMSEDMVDLEKAKTDPFYPDNIDHRTFHPFGYDSDRGFLHTKDWAIKRQFMQETYGDRFSIIEHFWRPPTQ